MNKNIKHMVESFDFSSANKQKKNINVYDVLMPDKIRDIVIKIISKPSLGMKDKNFISSLPDGIYQTADYEIQKLVKKCIKFFGKNCNLNWIDTGNVTDMSYLFYNTKFNGDISQWDVRKVINMDAMFEFSEFNGDISQWDVSNVRHMGSMFMYSQFNGNINNWNISNVT